MDLGMVSATGNPSAATIDEIMRDAMMCANAGITGIGGIAKAGVNMYNAMGNLFSGNMGQQANPYSANMGMYQQTVPMAQYAYAEGGMGYGTTPYLNTMNPQMMMGYPGFADPDYGSGMSMGYPGFGGKL